MKGFAIVDLCTLGGVPHVFPQHMWESHLALCPMSFMSICTLTLVKVQNVTFW